MFDIGVIKNFSANAKDKIIITLMLELVEEFKGRDDTDAVEYEAALTIIRYHCTTQEIKELGL